ncbi:hypothetical protein ACLOJK_041514 [Asimina triloba]
MEFWSRKRGNFWVLDMGLGNLFIAASMPVLKLLIVTGVGSLLATKGVGNGILDKQALKHLNNIIYFEFAIRPVKAFKILNLNLRT